MVYVLQVPKPYGVSGHDTVHVDGWETAHTDGGAAAYNRVGGAAAYNRVGSKVNRRQTPLSVHGNHWYRLGFRRSKQGDVSVCSMHCRWCRCCTTVCGCNCETPMQLCSVHVPTQYSGSSAGGQWLPPRCFTKRYIARKGTVCP